MVAVAALFPALVGLSLRFGGSRTTAGWCIMVADFALNVALPQIIRRKALPSGDSDKAVALPSAAAPALEGEAGKGETQKVRGTDSQPEYEVDGSAGEASGANTRLAGKRDVLDDDLNEGA